MPGAHCRVVHGKWKMRQYAFAHAGKNKSEFKKDITGKRPALLQTLFDVGALFEKNVRGVITCLLSLCLRHFLFFFLKGWVFHVLSILSSTGVLRVRSLIVCLVWFALIGHFKQPDSRYCGLCMIYLCFRNLLNDNMNYGICGVRIDRRAYKEDSGASRSVQELTGELKKSAPVCHKVCRNLGLNSISSAWRSYALITRPQLGSTTASVFVFPVPISSRCASFAVFMVLRLDNTNGCGLYYLCRDDTTDKL